MIIDFEPHVLDRLPKLGDSDTNNVSMLWRLHDQLLQKTTTLFIEEICEVADMISHWSHHGDPHGIFQAQIID